MGVGFDCALLPMNNSVGIAYGCLCIGSSGRWVRADRRNHRGTEDAERADRSAKNARNRENRGAVLTGWSGSAGWGIRLCGVGRIGRASGRGGRIAA
jgi:hypothetical protein